MPAVSVVCMLVPQPVELNGVSGSLTVQLTVTLLWYQPLLPSVPVTDEVITGAVVSFRMWRSAVACRLAAPNEALASSVKSPNDVGPVCTFRKDDPPSGTPVKCDTVASEGVPVTLSPRMIGAPP